ncbi:MAG: ATP synthase F1 subunit gamma [Saprospiraceae bacterium]|nr:ATP synthase F1 subunit gamma [Saprospiraceae bacterium]
MANLKEVRVRIASVISTQQITKAMKMVSASKLRKAQNAITQMRPYADKQNQMLSNILSNLEGDAETTFGIERDIQNAALVVVTSNRGLCGAFNTNIIKAATTTINEKYATQRDNGKLTIICIGKKGNDFFKRRYPNAVVSDFVDMFNDLSFDNVKRAAQMLMDGFEQKKFDHITVAYGRFKNAAMQFPEAEQFLPVKKMEVKKSALGASKRKADYVFEPDKSTLLQELVPSILQTTFYKFLLDTHASEHGARMTAMDKATENANELLKNLRINYNKARQEAITKELSEIVGGAAALES